MAQTFEDFASDVDMVAFDLSELVNKLERLRDSVRDNPPHTTTPRALLEDSSTISDAEAALETAHRAHDERWPARMCDLCRPIADALALFDYPVEVD